MRKYFILAAAALAMVACSNEENENSLVQNTDNVIRLTASVGNAAQTRAGSALLVGNFEENMQVTVKPTDKATPALATYDEVTYTVGTNGALTTSTTQYYPVGGGAVDVYAYYPYNASKEANGFAVALDQSTDADYKASDLMYATLTNINKNSASHNLAFEHQLSKITVTLVKGTGLQDAELAAATVTLKDVVYKGTFAPNTNTIFTTATASSETKGDIIIATNAGSTEHSAIVLPQDVADKKLAITIGAITQEYSIPAETTFLPTKHYRYTITVSPTAITVSSSITDWVNATQDPVSGGVTF